MEDLSNNYDIIILGTGLGSSLLAGALGRIGKNVLQLDRNDYYGSDYASFTAKEIQNKKLSKRINVEKCELEEENRVTINLGLGFDNQRYIFISRRKRVKVLTLINYHFTKNLINNYFF